MRCSTRRSGTPSTTRRIRSSVRRRASSPVTTKAASGNRQPATVNQLRNVDAERHDDRDPVEHQLRMLPVDDREVEGERFHVRTGLWGDVELHEVLILDARVLRVERRVRTVQDHRPHRRTGFRPQRVSPRGHRPSVDSHLGGERQRGAFIRAGTPDAIVWNERAEKVAAARHRPVVLDGDRRARHLLDDRAVLARLDRCGLLAGAERERREYGENHGVSVVRVVRGESSSVSSAAEITISFSPMRLKIAAGILLGAAVAGGAALVAQGGRGGGRAGWVSIAEGQECPPGTTEARHLQCAPPDSTPPTILDYRPRSTVVAPAHLVPKAKFPVVDVHTHGSASFINNPDRITEMDALNLRVLVDLSGGTDPAVIKRKVDAINASAYKDRFRVFANVAWDGAGGAGWKEKALTDLRQAVKNGANPSAPSL